MIGCFNISAQDISFSDMKLLLNSNISESEDFLISKGYKFFNYEKRYDCQNYDFAYDKNLHSDKAYGFVTINICPSNETTIIQSTSNERLIPKIKSEAVNSGLKYLKSEPIEGKMIHYYGNNIYFLMVLSQKSDEGFTTYEIGLERI